MRGGLIRTGQQISPSIPLVSLLRGQRRKNPCFSQTSFLTSSSSSFPFLRLQKVEGRGPTGGGRRRVGFLDNKTATVEEYKYSERGGRLRWPPPDRPSLRRLKEGDKLASSFLLLLDLPFPRRISNGCRERNVSGAISVSEWEGRTTTATRGRQTTTGGTKVSGRAAAASFVLLKAKLSSSKASLHMPINDTRKRQCGSYGIKAPSSFSPIHLVPLSLFQRVAASSRERRDRGRTEAKLLLVFLLLLLRPRHDEEELKHATKKNEKGRKKD